MVLEDVDRDAAQEVTPMSEIRRRRGMLLEVFTHINPGWVWSEQRRERLMHDEQGRCWVPMFSPEDGLYIDYDPLFTPQVEEALVEEARRARKEILNGGGVSFAELDADESFWDDPQCAFEFC